MTRSGGRTPQQLRPIRIVPDVAPNAQGSVLIGFGNTQVICTAMVESGVPRWMKEQQVSGGWLTAEYSMLPYSTAQRKARDSSRGRPDGRSTEIQRLIGRSLRAVVDLAKLDGFTIWVDCDVLQADGGTRTASITGACLACELAFQKLLSQKKLTASPLRKKVAAVSAGVCQGTPCLDLDYSEDRDATVDFNFVLTEDLEYVEVQGSGEEATFSQEEMDAMLALSRDGILTLCRLQSEALEAAARAAPGPASFLERLAPDPAS